MRAARRDHQLNHPAHHGGGIGAETRVGLGVEIDPDIAREDREGLRERRHARAGEARVLPRAGIELLQRGEIEVQHAALPIGRPVHGRVVHEHDLTIAGQREVEFHHVCPQPHRLLQRRNGVLRMGPTRPAMGTQPAVRQVYGIRGGRVRSRDEEQRRQGGEKDRSHVTGDSRKEQSWAHGTHGIHGKIIHPFPCIPCVPWATPHRVLSFFTSAALSARSKTAISSSRPSQFESLSLRPPKKC